MRLNGNQMRHQLDEHLKHIMSQVTVEVPESRDQTIKTGEQTTGRSPNQT